MKNLNNDLFVIFMYGVLPIFGMLVAAAILTALLGG